MTRRQHVARTIGSAEGPARRSLDTVEILCDVNGPQNELPGPDGDSFDGGGDMCAITHTVTQSYRRAHIVGWVSTVGWIGALEDYPSAASAVLYLASGGYYVATRVPIGSGGSISITFDLGPGVYEWRLGVAPVNWPPAQYMYFDTASLTITLGQVVDAQECYLTMLG